MCYDSATGAMYSYTNWSHVSATGWYSYPSVVYGVNEWLGQYSTFTNMSPIWTIPRPVSDVVNDSYWVVVNYSFHPPPSSATAGYDFSLDDFFTESQTPEFEVGPFVEVMVWFAHHITYPSGFSTFSAPTLVNSSVASEPWAVADYCHGPDNSSNQNVSFDFSYLGQSSGGVRSGTLGVNLSLLLGQVERMMPSTSCWEGPTDRFSALYLDEANLGSEDGALVNSTFNYNWTVGGYCYFTKVSAPSALNLPCPGLARTPAAAARGFDELLRTAGPEGTAGSWAFHNALAVLRAEGLRWAERRSW
jgi:hypothetical protein